MSAETTPKSGSNEPLIEVKNLVKYFPIHKGLLGRKVGDVKAVDNISFDIKRNETLGLVGESGCGKTTAGRTLLRLLDPTSGEAIYKGHDLFQLSQKELRPLRRNLQIIFQDPYSSLNPRMTVENIIGDAMEIHGIAKGPKKRELVKDLLERVGLQPRYVSRYPHEFSGGQRQRIGIARALALNPEFIVCDEAVSALDVSIQAQVINLLEELQQDFHLSYLFIAHDLAVVRHLADRVAVMYLGQLVEVSDCDDLFAAPAHPYTRALLSAIPVPDPRRKSKRIILEGDVPTPINPPKGCRFHTRCPAVFPLCRTEIPELTAVEDGHLVACHLFTQGDMKSLPLPQQIAEVGVLMGLEKEEPPEPDAKSDVSDESAVDVSAEEPAETEGPAQDDDSEVVESSAEEALSSDLGEVVAPEGPTFSDSDVDDIFKAISGDWPSLTGETPKVDKDGDDN